MRNIGFAAIAALCLAVSPAQAHKYHHHRVTIHHATYHHHRHIGHRHRPIQDDATVIAHKRPVVSHSQEALSTPLDLADRIVEAASKKLSDLLPGWKAPIIVRQRPYHFTGELKIGELTVDFGTGGEGRGSIPYGDYEIKPTSDDSVGNWGKRHGALGLNSGEINDKQQRLTREGIELHQAHHMASAGCVAIEQFAKAKKAILALIDSEGSAFLHVWPGIFTVDSDRHIDRPVIVLTEAQKFAVAEHIAHHHHTKIARAETHRHHEAAHHVHHHYVVKNQQVAYNYAQTSY